MKKIRGFFFVGIFGLGFFSCEMRPPASVAEVSSDLKPSSQSSKDQLGSSDRSLSKNPLLRLEGGDFVTKYLESRAERFIVESGEAFHILDLPEAALGRDLRRILRESDFGKESEFVFANCNETAELTRSFLELLEVRFEPTEPMMARVLLLAHEALRSVLYSSPPREEFLSGARVAISDGIIGLFEAHHVQAVGDDWDEVQRQKFTEDFRTLSMTHFLRLGTPDKLETLKKACGLELGAGGGQRDFRLSQTYWWSAFEAVPRGGVANVGSLPLQHAVQMWRELPDLFRVQNLLEDHSNRLKALQEQMASLRSVLARAQDTLHRFPIEFEQSAQLHRQRLSALHFQHLREQERQMAIELMTQYHLLVDHGISATVGLGSFELRTPHVLTSGLRFRIGPQQGVSNNHFDAVLEDLRRIFYLDLPGHRYLVRFDHKGNFKPGHQIFSNSSDVPNVLDLLRAQVWQRVHAKKIAEFEIVELPEVRSSIHAGLDRLQRELFDSVGLSDATKARWNELQAEVLQVPHQGAGAELNALGERLAALLGLTERRLSAPASILSLEVWVLDRLRSQIQKRKAVATGWTEKLSS